MALEKERRHLAATISNELKISPELLKEYFYHDPVLGIVYNKKYRNSRALKDKEAGCTPKKDSYKRIYFLGAFLLVHRVIWCLEFGYWPTTYLDHIDQNKKNNCIENLREVTAQINCLNKSKPNKNNASGFLGVVKTPGNRYTANLSINKKHFFLGTFDSPEEASLEYTRRKETIFDTVD